MSSSRTELWIRQVALKPVVGLLEPALYLVALLWRRLLFRTTFIAITGSMGKTTTKECLGAILKSAASTFKSPRNAGGRRQVALNTLRVRPWHRYAVIEISVAGPGQMRAPARLVRPDVAVILNVKRTHITEYRDQDQIATEKAVLLDHLSLGGIALLNRDDERVAKMSTPPGREVRYFGSGAGCEYRTGQVSANWPQRLRFVLQCPSGEQTVRTQLVGTHWTAACAAAMAAADVVGVPPERAAIAMRDAPPFPGRLAPYRLPNGAIVLRDDYGASVEGVEAAFRVMEAAEAERRLLVVSDITYFDGHRSQRLRFLAEWALRCVDVVVFVGSKSDYGVRQAVAAGIRPENAHGFASLEPAAELLRRELREGDVVLIEGRTTDHITRVFMAQLGRVECWKEYCEKRMLCDICWKLGLTGQEMQRAVPVRQEWD